YGKTSSVIEFAFDRKARLTDWTASFVSLFGLGMGESLYDRTGDSGRDALDGLLRGRRSQAAFTLFTHPRLRPVPVLAQASEDGRFRALAITLQWTDAIAPSLKSGYNLTASEIDVVHLLFQGHQPKEIAAQRETSLETVRTQIRNICHKTDTHGQSDIVHLIYGLIATTQHVQADQTAAVHGNFVLTLPSGRRMDVECSGPETGRPLLFLHGCMGGRRLSDAVRAEFSDRRIIAPGRPGHGQTPADETLSVQDVVKDLFSVLDHFGIGAVEVLTYDLGAPYGLWMAQIQPQRVLSLTCLAPVPPIVDWRAIRALPVEMRVFSVLARANPSAAHYLAVLGGQRILRQGHGDFGKIVFGRLMAERALLDRDECAQKLFWYGHAWHVERGPYGFLSDARLSSDLWSDGLSKLKAHVKFFVGVHDRNAPRANLEELAAQVGAEIVDIRDAGHSILHTSAKEWITKLP
ncbi:MAG: alpha/beta fold hydrolase, partial [Pseudomonadota bacterium]